MLGKVMVPLDGSVFAESALPVARAIVRHGGGSLELVTVHEPIPAFAQDDWEESARDWSEQYLREVTRRLGEIDIPVEPIVLSGHVAETLEEHASSDEHRADLVVMATHGRGTFSRAWLGSVADHFVRHSPCPVLLVRPEREEKVDVTTEWSCDRILVPVDGTEFSESILGYVMEFGRLLDAAVTLVQVVAYPLEIASPYLPHTVQMNQQVVDDAKEAARKHLERVADQLAEDGVEADVKVLVDTQAGHGILRASEEVDADMIAMATHGRGGMSRAVLGSSADKVIRGTHRPVFVHRPDPRLDA